MLISISILLLSALILGELSRLVGLPSLVGMIVAGMIVGPYGADLLCGELLAVSSDLRSFALVVILMRVGLSLDLGLLQRSGRVTALLSFLPALFEIVGVMVLAPILFGVSLLEAAVMGCVVAAVSPAVIVPRMIGLRSNPKAKRVSQVVMVASSLDDLLVIVLFSIALKMGLSGEFSPELLFDLPLSLVVGVVVGLVVGYLLSWLFKRYSIRDTYKVVMILAVSLAMLGFDSAKIPFSPLLAVICLGAVLGRRNGEQAERLSSKCDKVWTVAQLLLFSLVGAQVDISYAWASGGVVVVLILGALIWRIAGVWFSTLGSGFSRNEKYFTMIAYTPKATVQAAIGAIPLSAGLASGELILGVAVVAILLTAPLGAIGIDWGARRLL